MINDKNGLIMMWDANTGKTTPIDSGLRYTLLLYLL